MQHMLAARIKPLLFGCYHCGHIIDENYNNISLAYLQNRFRYAGEPVATYGDFTQFQWQLSGHFLA